MNTKYPKKSYPVPYNHAEEPQLDKDGTLGIELNVSAPVEPQYSRVIVGDPAITGSYIYSGGTCNTPQIDEPVPPPKHIRGAEHHWLEKKDCDGHSAGFIVLQWNPFAKRWSHSGCVGTGGYIDTKYWIYKGYCPIPEF